MNRATIAKYGQRPYVVNVFREKLSSGRVLARVEWREHHQRKTRSWADDKDGRRLAKAFALTTKNRLEQRGSGRPEIVRVNVGELFEKYVNANVAKWRPATLKNARNNWRLFQETVAPTVYADHVTQETLDEVRKTLRNRRIAPNQVRAATTRVLAVWNWARRRALLSENLLAGYDNALPKDGQPLDVPEYTPDDVAKIIGQFDYRTSRAWRPWCAIQLASLLGARQNALLNLEWSDVDLAARTVRWRPALDKRGKDRTQPLPRDAVKALRVAWVWRQRAGHTGRFVFFAVQARRGDAPWTYAALSASLTEAEGRAGIPHVKFRGMHGFRRGAAHNVLALTNGDLNKAGEWIGDTDLRTLKRSYLKSRPEELRAVANLMTMPTQKKEAVATEQQSVAAASMAY